VKSGGDAWTVSAIHGDKATCVNGNGKEKVFTLAVLMEKPQDDGSCSTGGPSD